MGLHVSPAAAASLLQARTLALVALFEQVGTTRMQGVPILNPALQVVAIGFELSPGPQAPEPPSAVGILITPWFMNLVCFPLARVDSPQHTGRSRTLAVGSECFDFIAGHEPSFGSYDACSLFSPMFNFPDQAEAVATAHAVLDSLRPAPAPQATVATKSVPADTAPDRRAFLFGRRAVPSEAAP